MPASDDLLLGKIAVKLRYASQEQVNECVRQQIDQAPPMPLGEILVSKGFLTRPQLDEILEMQKRSFAALDPVHQKRRESVLFGRLLVREGIVPADAVNECLRIQASPEGLNRTLGEIMVDKGYLTRERVKEILSQQLKKIMRCDPCSLSFTVISSTGGKSVVCPRCKGGLRDARPTDTVRSDGEFATQNIEKISNRFPAVEPKKDTPPPRPVRLRCVICDAAFRSPLDDTGRAQCPECHTRFTPRHIDRF